MLERAVTRLAAHKGGRVLLFSLAAAAIFLAGTRGGEFLAVVTGAAG